MGPELYESKAVTSRGKIICDACFVNVPQGVEYRRDTWKDGTHKWSVRYCPYCTEMLPDIEKWMNTPHVPCDAPVFEEWVIEHATDTRAYPWYRRAYPGRDQ